MDKVLNYIQSQMRAHTSYANSFEKALSTSNEQIHPKTRKRITFLEKQSLIDSDAKNRSRRILKKLSEINK